MPAPAFDVALDAMGGDHAPRVPIEAAYAAAERGLKVALVGDRERIFASLGGRSHHGLFVHHAADVIGMDAKISRALLKRASSIRVAAELVQRGEAAAMLSAGHSGAVMGGALLVLGRIPGIQRPAIAAAIPTVRRPLTLLDLGANADPSGFQLFQFGLLGDAFARVVLGRAEPAVALLSNGSEASKGTERTRAADAFFRRSALHYRGYCEGRDLFGGELDVVVTDGFTGNVLLKTIEGLVVAIRQIAEQEIRGSLTASAGALLMKPSLSKLKARLDDEEAGAAPLLGLNGRCFVAHGASTVNALTNALFSAYRMDGQRLDAAIRESVERHLHLGTDSESHESEAPRTKEADDDTAR